MGVEDGSFSRSAETSSAASKSPLASPAMSMKVFGFTEELFYFSSTAFQPAASTKSDRWPTFSVATRPPMDNACAARMTSPSSACGSAVGRLRRRARMKETTPGKFYPHLRAEGKPAKVAQTAVMRKLLLQMNRVLKEHALVAQAKTKIQTA